MVSPTQVYLLLPPKACNITKLSATISVSARFDASLSKKITHFCLIYFTVSENGRPLG